MESEKEREANPLTEQIEGGELNSWRRGFTPQAEIWNGRMAMFGLSVGILILFLVAFFG
mgnify:CR=1 FL=1